MKKLSPIALALGLAFACSTAPAFAGAPEVDPSKEQAPKEEQQQEEQQQREQGFLDLLARRGRGAGVVCFSRNLEGRVFRAFGRDAVDTQARALNGCYARSFGLLKGTCIPTGCRGF